MKKVIILILCVATVYGVFYISPYYVTQKCYKDLDYYVMSDNTIKIFGYTGKKNQVLIPEKIENKTVSKISQNSIGFAKNGSVIKDFVINGYTGSAAEKYAKNSGILFNCLHKFKDTVTSPATYKKEGEMLQTCDCGYSYTKTISRPAVPKVNLTKISADGFGVRLDWQKIKGIDNYYIYRSTDNADFTQIASADKVNYYTDTSAKSGAKLKYYVIGYASDNVGKEKSAVLSIDYLAAPVFKLQSAKNGVNITWTQCDGVSGYYVYRKTDGEFKKIATLNSASNISYTDKNVKKKIEYTYTMRSFTNDQKQSGFIPNGKTIEYGKNAKVVYLTFDDGPSKNTLKILKILKQYNAKATFFVTANGITKNMKNIIKAGSAIGLHSYSHNYSKIYSSTDNYFADLKKIHDLVLKETGVDSRIIRFPGGASNTVSASYNKGIMSALAKEVENAGYQYFDWNVSSGDAEGDGIPASKLIRNVRRDTGNQTAVVVLMHDTKIKKTTVEALPSICKYYQSKGYEFDVLTTDSPVCHQGINN